MSRKRAKPGILFVTISGAQGTGKSTIAASLCGKLNKEHGKGCAIFVPSFTGRLFDRLKNGAADTIRATLPKLDETPKTYDDIDRLGLRRWYQTNLPDACAFEVESVLLSIRWKVRKRPLYFIVLDRWFPDIMAYTKIEARDDAELPGDVEAICRSVYLSIHQNVTNPDGDFGTVSELNVFVPLSASNFEVSGQQGKFRATCDRDIFERECLSAWKPTVGRGQPHLTITQTDRTRRLTEVMQAIDETRAHRV